MRKVLVLGAASAIARETIRLLAVDGDRLFLVARDAERLSVLAADLRVRGADRIESAVADLDDASRHGELIERAASAMDGLDTVIVAYGILGDADRSRTDPAEVTRIFRTNLVGPSSLLTLVAERFEKQGSGLIVGISSVAGDRGRQSNYAYGASKGGMTLFLQGLRNRLQPSGVRVLTIKPGMVDTPMTEQMPKGPLFASPQAIARGIHRAMQRNRDVVYLPWFWRWIMWVIRCIPEPLFKRMKL